MKVEAASLDTYFLNLGVGLRKSIHLCEESFHVRWLDLTGE